MSYRGVPNKFCVLEMRFKLTIFLPKQGHKSMCVRMYTLLLNVTVKCSQMSPTSQYAN